MKSKNDFKIGDRVRVVSVPDFLGKENSKIRLRMRGTVKDLSTSILGCIGIEFDDNIDGNDGRWGGKNGYCWYVPQKCLGKIEETKVEKMNIDKEMVNHPLHYTSGKVECIDAIESATGDLTGIEAVCTGNVIKYVWRWKLKNGIEDLEKASWYLHKLIEKKKDDKYKDEIRKSSIFENNAL